MPETPATPSPLRYPATAHRKTAVVIATLACLAVVGCGIGLVREMLQGHFITGWIVGLFFAGVIAKHSLGQALNRWEFTATPTHLGVWHGPWPKSKAWEIQRQAGQKLVRVEERCDDCVLSCDWYLRDARGDHFITDKQLSPAFETELMARLGFAADDLVVESFAEQTVAQSVRDAATLKTPPDGELRYRWWKSSNLPGTLVGLAIAGTAATMLGSIFRPWENPHWPASGMEWLVVGVFTLVFCVFCLSPLLMAAGYVFNTTSVRIEGEHLIIAHKPVGLTHRFRLADIMRLETTTESRKSGRSRATHWLLTAHLRDGSQTTLLDTTEETFPLPALAHTRTLIENWQRRNGIRPLPPGMDWDNRGRRRSAKEWAGLGCLGLFFVPFVGAGLLMLGMGAWNLGVRDWAHRDWPTTQATVVEHKILPPVPNDTGNDRWLAQLVLRAPMEAGTRVVSGESSDDYRTATGCWRQHPVGTTCGLRLDPQDPASAEIPGESRKSGLILLAIGGGWTAMVACFIRLATRRKDRPESGGKAKEPSPWGRAAALLFCLAFGAAGGTALWFSMLSPLRRHLRSADWQPTPCIVEAVRWLEHSGGKNGPVVAPDVLYRYEAGGQTWRSNQLDFTGSTKNSPFAQWQAGKQAQCLVNPADPSEATLSRDWWHSEGGGGWVGLVVGGIFFLIGLAGVIGIAWGWVAARKFTRI